MVAAHLVPARASITRAEESAFADPKNVDRVYAIEPILQVTDDGGKTFHRVGERNKHVDNHVIWIDPNNTNYYLVGCDGGVYESFDRGVNWNFKANLPVAQFYDVAVDNQYPFYNVYGGTQDNYSLGGPANKRTLLASEGLEERVCSQRCLQAAGRVHGD